MTVRVAVWGTLAVVRGSESLSGPRLGTRKARALLAALAAGRGAPVPADRLVQATWGKYPPRDPQGNLATLVSRLRRVAGNGLIRAAGTAYALGEGVGLDLDLAAELVDVGTARLARGEPALALTAAQRALRMLGEDGSLAPECDGPWAETLRRESAGVCREGRHLLATAAIGVGLPDLARRAADAAVSDDPYDERATRDLMIALALDGRASAALEVYAALATRLADELGTDPDPSTREVHLQVLRGERPGGPELTAPHRDRAALVGRDEEVEVLDRAWVSASAGRAEFVLITGVPGIGKTRLLDEALGLAAGSGGLILTARCLPGERSLFLQPYLEVLRPVLLALPRDSLERLLGPHAPAWAGLMPEIGEILGVTPDRDISGTLARRRAFDGMVAVIAGLAVRQPVLLTVDDLQYGADVTADLLAHLAARLGPARVLLVGAARSAALSTLAPLAGRGSQVRLGPLPPSAVNALAAAAGFADRGGEVVARTQGHPLSVIATLQALAAGTTGLPDTVALAVAGQVDRLDAGDAAAAGAASVLGTRVDPVTLAALIGRDEVAAVLACERAVAAGLMTPVGARYEFVNDLIRDAVLAALPRPLLVAYHRRAADLLSARPEAMAGHAHEAGEPARAASGYLLAGQTARKAAALDDALALLGLAEGDARAADDPRLIAGVLLERSRVQEARADFAAAHRDAVSAEEPVARARDPRLEMRRLRLLGGDLAVGRRLPIEEGVAHNQIGLDRAHGLGDAVSAAMFASRLAVLECSRLRLAPALVMATEAVARSRASGLPEALARSLDGLKSVHAYAGDAPALAAVLAELLPLLEEQRLPWLRQWAIQEGALVPAAGGDWDAAREWIDRALAVNRETGYGAYQAYFLAQRGWFARLAGDLDAALEDGRRAVADLSPSAHPWWYATAVGGYAASLLQAGRLGDIAALCAHGLEALGPGAGAAYRLRCLAPLAALTGEGLAEADDVLARIDAPAGRAWIAGADVYEALVTAWLGAGEPERAARVARPLLVATRDSWRAVHDRVSRWFPPDAIAGLGPGAVPAGSVDPRRGAQSTSATSAAARSAPSEGTST